MQRQEGEKVISGGSFEPKWRGAWCQHEAKTIVELFETQADTLGDHTLYLYKREGAYRPISWTEVQEQVHALAAGLVGLGIEPGDRVAILAENSLEWVLADQAILHAGAISVTLHAPLTSAQIQEQIADSGAVAVFVSKETQSQKILTIRNQLPTLKHVISFEPVSGVLFLRELQEEGRRLLRDKPNLLQERRQAIGWDTIATLIYTSGTTGESKGVMLSHGNLLSNMYGVMPLFPPEEQENILLSFLPLSHIYARQSDYLYAMGQGIIMAIAESIEALPQNLQEVRPHGFNGVPRLYEKVRERILQVIEDKIVLRLLGKFAIRKAIARAFGGRVKWTTAGGAALDPTVEAFFLEHGLELFQGYGLTEASPVVSCNHPHLSKPGTVGKPIPGVEVKIAPDGEILVRGPNVMKGYWDQPEATREVLEPDGWLHTGDVGELDEEGFLHITDRKKDIFVLAGGKNIAPAALENALTRNPYIEQAVVYGDKKKFVSGILVPAMSLLTEWAQKQGLPFGSPEELVHLPQVYALIEEQVNEALKNFAPYERVRRFLLLPEPFTLEGGDVTITLKMRRTHIFERFREQLEALHEEPQK